jgi:hypothetical protein
MLAEAMLLTKLQRAISLLDRPHRPHHEGRNMVAHAARLLAPWGWLGPGVLRRFCAVCLPLAAIVVVLAMRCGLALLWLAVGLWLTMGLGRALVLRRAV